MSELPSRTSIWAAAGRAIGSRHEKPEVRNPDYFADQLLGPAERELLAPHPLAAALASSDPQAYADPEVYSAAATLIIRTKFIEERLTLAIAGGATQVVIMGAGWDTRAYRLTELLNKARVFEIDQPSTQNWKRRRAEEVIGPPPANLTYLPIDFRHQTLAEVLLAGGYDPVEKTFFIWEGVTMYLPETAIRDTLRWIASQAAGSAVVFDFVDRALIDYIRSANFDAEPPNEAARIGLERLRQIAKWGEPWIFGIPKTTEAQYLQELGMEHRLTLGMSSQEAATRYLGWAQETAFPAAIRQMYSILEAVVPLNPSRAH
ncbi:MAG: SAM-dependent methyltransferase [Acidobacteriota bacterium]